MRLTELKKLIGNQAQQIIVSDLSLKQKGSLYSCPITKHHKDTISTKWYSDSCKFYCHDCKKTYDIIDHSNNESNRMEYLCKLANIDYTPKEFKALKPITTKTSTEGYNYLQERGISKRTIKDYKVRADKETLYFHYATPDKKLVKIKKRLIAEKKFFAEAGGEEILYGLHLFKNQKGLILCEGEIDCLTIYEIICQMGKEKEFLCSSVPNGAGSLNESCINNCSEYLDQFEFITIIPDNDEAGKILEYNALKYLGQYKLDSIRLPRGIKDVNELYQSPDHNPCDIFKLSKKLIPRLSGVYSSSKVSVTKLKDGVRTGFITHDYNDNGLKQGKLTVITGKRGDGKTTYCRQIIISCAKQGVKSFMFCGETKTSNEKSKLARLCAEKGEIVKNTGIAGNYIYTPSLQAEERYNKYYSNHIFMADIDTIKRNGKLFKNLLIEMRKMALHYGVEVFELDNLMVMCEQQGSYLFSEQKNIIISLGAFAEEMNVHVIIVAHPKKGKGEELVSGAAEIENYADTIIRYLRLDDEQKAQLAKKMPSHKLDLLERASARTKVEKIRDDGNKKIGWFEWDAVKGAVYDISDLDASKWYEEQGYWTKSLLRR